MSSLGLSHNDKQAIQSFTENLQALDNQEFASFTVSAHSGNEAAWSRFIKGAYNHPITWWIGIFQLQMQTGLWGQHYQASATLRANELWKISKPLRKEATGTTKGDDAPMLSAIVRYNWEHRKADILGRMLGGKFTSYATMGGAKGRARISSKYIKFSVAATNLTIASYGAGIKALIEGSNDLEQVIQSILTGSTNKLPKSYKYDAFTKPSEEEKLLKGMEQTLDGVMSLSRISAAPIPINEFCSRPENINIKGLCK